MTVELIEVKTPRQLRRFMNLPDRLYKNHPYYVPALRPDEVKTLHWRKNPAFDYCEARYWLAYRDGQPAGRVAAILNHKHIEKWGQRYLRFGWLDFVDDAAVVDALFGVVEAWARQKNLTALHGPLGFTDLDREGMLIEGFDELGTLATLYNYPYYPKHMARLGFKKDTDWMEYEITMPETLDERIQRAAEIVLRRHNLHLLHARNKQELLPYAPQLFEMINEEYSHLYGSVPLSPREIEHYTDAYFGFVHPDFVPVVLDEANQMVAFGVTIPSLSRALQKSRGRLFPFGWFHLLRALQVNKRADLYLIAVRKAYQGMGVNMVLMAQVYGAFMRRGIEKVESNPELEDNIDVQAQWKVFDKRQHKRRRCYIKRLD